MRAMDKISTFTLRTLPQHLDSEKALIGAVLVRPESIHDVVDIVSPDIFFSERHRLIWETIQELFSKSEPIDLLSLSSRLEEKSQLDRAGGTSYLAELAGSVPSAANIRYYAETVHRKHMMRKLIEASEHINRLGYEEAEDIEKLLDNAEQYLYELSSSGGMRKVTDIKTLLNQAWERIEHLSHTKEEIRGVPSGFRDLDMKLAGFQKSDLIILAARPSMGKTALALDIARKTSTDYNTPVLIFSLEMAAQQLIDRMVAAEARVNAWNIRTGHFSMDSDFDRMRHAVDRLSKAPIFINDEPGNNILKMRSLGRRLKREKGLQLIIVDYLQLMTPINTRNSDSSVQQVTELSRSLKHLARDLDVPVIALSQLSRAVEQRGGKPRLSDLRDSGSIEQDADVVMFIHREDKYKEDSDKINIAEILIEKHRNGPTGKVDLYFDDKKSMFLPVDKSGFGDFSEPTQNF